MFETLVVSEFVKGAFHSGQVANLYFWRDSAGNEVDLLFERDGKLHTVEIKSGATLVSEWLDAAGRWTAIAGMDGHFEPT